MKSLRAAPTYSSALSCSPSLKVSLTRPCNSQLLTLCHFVRLQSTNSDQATAKCPSKLTRVPTVVIRESLEVHEFLYFSLKWKQMGWQIVCMSQLSKRTIVRDLQIWNTAWKTSKPKKKTAKETKLKIQSIIRIAAVPLKVARKSKLWKCAKTYCMTVKIFA